MKHFFVSAIRRIPWKVLLFVIFLVTSWLWYWHQSLQYPAQPKINPQHFLQTVSALPSGTEDQLQLVTEPDDGMQPVATLLSNASTSVDLVVYELEDATIEQALVTEKNRGVTVRVLLQNVDTFGTHPNQEAYDFLQKNKVSVKWAPEYFTLTHQKTLIVDGKTALVMTYNLTAKYYNSSRDFGIIDNNKNDVTAIEDTFNKDWQDNGGIAENGDDLVWSPGSEPVLLALINSAKTFLDVYNEEMADPHITSALENAAKRGVTVRVDMTYATDWKSAFNELTTSGVQVRTYASSAKFYIHAKAIIRDQTLVFLGSENFSEQSLDYNRELGMLLSNKDIISSLETTFNNDWEGSRPFFVGGN